MLISHSRLPLAEAFMDWVTSGVMPSIRNTARLEDAKKREEDLVKSHADSANIFEDLVNKHADSVTNLRGFEEEPRGFQGEPRGFEEEP